MFKVAIYVPGWANRVYPNCRATYYGQTVVMTRADDDDAGVAGIVGVPPACGGEWRA
jgi:hypothetical protein